MSYRTKVKEMKEEVDKLMAEEKRLRDSMDPGDEITQKERFLKVQKIEVYRYSSDDWYPSFPRSKVRVSLITHEGSIDKWELNRVCVWGADDTGLEKDLSSLGQAASVFSDVLNMKDITKRRLMAMGFARV